MPSRHSALAMGTALLALAPCASAHMILAQPVPYGSPNNSPFDPSGSDYPCKNVPFDVKTMNDWKVGSEQTMQWSGSATHGGGSCQIAITTDEHPTANSKFKVIYSIEGGCPASNAPGQNGGTPTPFKFIVPKEVPNGQLTALASWFNHVGNREMYGNCAPVTISGGSDDKSAFNALPDLAVANIKAAGGDKCNTPDNSDFTFKNPGKYSTRIGNGPFAPLCKEDGSNSGAAPSSAPVGDGRSTPTQPPALSSAATSAPAISGVVTSTIHTMVTVTAPTAAAPSTGVATSSGSTQGAVASTPSPQVSQASPSGGSGTTCSTDGSIVCNGDSQFGICNHGKVVFQAVAAGTKCQNGAIAKRDYTHRAQRTWF